MWSSRLPGWRPTSASPPAPGTALPPSGPPGDATEPFPVTDANRTVHSPGGDPGADGNGRRRGRWDLDGSGPDGTPDETPDDDSDAAVEAPPGLPIRELFSRFWPDTRGTRGWILVGFGLTALTALAGAVDVWLYKVLVDDVLAPHRFTAFPLLAGLYVGVALAGGAIGFASQYLAARVGELFVFRLRTRVFDHLQTLSVDFFDRRRLGDTLSRLSADVQAIEALVLSGVVVTFSTIFELVLLTGVLVYLNWRLALLSFVLAPVFLVLSSSFTHRIREASRQARRRDGAITTVAEETFANATFVQAYGRQRNQRARFVTQSRDAMRAAVRAARISALFTPLVELLQVVGVVLIIGVGVWQLAADRVTLGGLLVFLVYLSQLYGPVNGLSELASTAFTAAAAGERLVELLDQRPHITASAAPIELGHVTGRLRLEHVSFRYPETGHDVLTDISFTLAPGTTTALVGASGAGKTTVTKLLLRLYDPTEGRVTLDGHDLRDIDPERLRQQLAVVLQETLLFDATIAENILAGRAQATTEDMYAAARAADAHEFITALPQGYQTRVGQRGRLLSGGQRQRVALARAMIRDAPVLILDEPTTGVDASATERILGPLRPFVASRATLIITHTLHTVTDADQVIYLENGCMAAAGSHLELLARHPGYAQLYAGDQLARAATVNTDSAPMTAPLAAGAASDGPEPRPELGPASCGSQSLAARPGAPPGPQPPPGPPAPAHRRHAALAAVLTLVLVVALAVDATLITEGPRQASDTATRLVHWATQYILGTGSVP
ncbi:MAG TPA: ABC transporter transmembrane domain-containing protein [Pseudonocardia sp.]|nr:ABC transporter transmembrane domain-containing protein [Pseudonocardia sp.]